jgi:hypothetical protein
VLGHRERLEAALLRRYAELAGWIESPVGNLIAPVYRSSFMGLPSPPSIAINLPLKADGSQSQRRTERL